MPDKLVRIDEDEGVILRFVDMGDGTFAPLLLVQNTGTTRANATARLPSSAASTNATSVKSAAAILYNVVAFNTTGATVFLKVYNKATAPVAGTDTPVLTLPIPAGGLALDVPGGLDLSAGLGYALTAGVADADSTAVAAGAVIGLNLIYR